MKKLLTFLPLFASASLFAENGQGGREGNSMQTIILLVVFVMFFYFILWRPERKRRKALQQQRDAMKPGDKVTAMGIVGTLDKIEDKTVIIKNIDGSKMEILKMAITEVQPVGGEQPSPQS